MVENSENSEDAAESPGDAVLSPERRTAEPENITRQTPPPLAIDDVSTPLFGIPMPPRDHADIMLELLMDDLNLTEEKKGSIKLLGDARKWIMVVQHLSQRYREAGQANEIEEITNLKENPEDKALLSALSVSLRSKPIRWIGSFIDAGGLQVLLWNLESLEDKNR